MIRLSKRAAVLMLGFALVAAACGDDDTATTEATTAAAEAPTTEAPTTEAPATTTTTTAAPAPTEAMALTPEQVIADNMIPLPPNTDLVSVEETDDGVRVGTVVNSPPPPGYAALLTDSDWEVVDVVFGSEATMAFYETAALCLLAYANYDSSDSPEYWIWFYIFTGLDAVDCLDATSDLISLMSGLGRPS